MRTEVSSDSIISLSGVGDITKDLEYGKPASRRFPRAFSFMISGRRTRRGPAEMPAKDILLSSGGEVKQRGEPVREGN